MTDRTWGVVKLIAPVRRTYFRAVAHGCRFARSMIFKAWRECSITHAPFSQAQFASSMSFRYLLDFIKIGKHFMALKKASRASLALDKENYLASVAEKADKCAIKGDHRSSYILVRQLGGNKPRQPLALEHEEGHIVSAPAAVRDRFICHFAGVFDANVCKFEDVEFKQGNQNVGGFVFVNQKVQRQISKLAKTKGWVPMEFQPNSSS